ncbi:MAG: N-acetylneuraminate synthase [Bacteroidota bacterium]
MKFERTFIIAEAGVNHNGSLDLAKQLIDVAVKAGADAVKFQTFKAEKLTCFETPMAEYQIKNTGVLESQYEMLKRLELDEADHKQLIEYCNSKKIQFLSTPFDLESIDLLVKKFNLPMIKIASGDITNAPLLLKAAQTGKPIILSTGMSDLGEIESALGVLAFGYLGVNSSPSRKAFKEAYFSQEGQTILKNKVSLLHCTTEYPASFSDINLRAINTLRDAFGVSIGFSDHSPGIAISIAAVAREASIIEKHFTLDRNLPGPDHKASLEPNELKLMVESIRQVELALGSPPKTPSPSEFKNIAIARKSLVAACDLKKGGQWDEGNLAVKRPGNGVSPMNYWDYLGRTILTDYKKDELIRE